MTVRPSILLFSLLPLALSAAVPLATRPHPPRPIDGDCPLARIKQGLYRGTHLNSAVSAFLGVPYAETPVRDLRFQPAVPLQPLEIDDGTIHDATHFGPVCWQFHYRTVLLNNTLETTPQSEDCLNANVFVPRRGKEEEGLLPVLLWSYGGGFVEGGGSMPGIHFTPRWDFVCCVDVWLMVLVVFDPRNLVASQGDMIVVTFK